MAASNMGRAIWVVGLPGCGKSTLVEGICQHLKEREVAAVVLAMDQRRKTYFPKPTYSDDERDQAYTIFVDEAAELVGQGSFVVMDGAAYKREFREYARERIPLFAEIFLHCSLDKAMEREASRPGGEVMAGMYVKALRRKYTGEYFDGLGDVIGVDVEFEANPNAELIIDNTDLNQEECLRKALHFLDTWLGNA